MDAMTSGFSAEADRKKDLWAWGQKVLKRINRTGGLPDFVVGRSGAVETLEDEGRTLVLPLPVDCPKCYGAINETGGVTLMLAEEY